MINWYLGCCPTEHYTHSIKLWAFTIEILCSALHRIQLSIIKLPRILFLMSKLYPCTKILCNVCSHINVLVIKQLQKEAKLNSAPICTPFKPSMLAKKHMFLKFTLSPLKDSVKKTPPHQLGLPLLFCKINTTAQCLPISY